MKIHRCGIEFYFRYHKYSDNVPASNVPNTGLDLAPLLPPERFVNVETSEVATFEEEKITKLDDVAFPHASTLADDAEDIDFIYPLFDV
uniref:Uncharacterized protein n=1 Tax=Panagrolaimus davidi TaxID=227884 RepID=A0A914Q764_9BILA